MSILKNLLGLDLPKEGIVRGKAIDQPRSLNYGGIVGVKAINEKPIYWLAIEVKGARGKNKIRNVPVSKKEYDAAVVDQQWTATE